MTLAEKSAPAKRQILLPKAPVLVPDGHRLFCLSAEGEPGYVTDDKARRLIAAEMPVVCHGPHIAARLKMQPFPAYDALELFAFVHPGKFCAPTPRGLARALHLLEPAGAEDQCTALRDAIRHMLADLSNPGREEKSDPAALAAMMGLAGQAEGDGGWPWTPMILAALGRRDNPPSRAEITAALKPWDRLPEWAVHAPESPPGHHDVTDEETAQRLHKLLSRQHREERPQQHAYAAALGHAFAPVNAEGQTRVVMAEAGTGTGKTLGYLAPATVWAEKNGGSVWVSTYTRNLQRQVDAELDRFYDDPVTKSRKVVTRKGRENYLCLLNLEDAAHSPAVHTNGPAAAALGLAARWAAVTADGDMGGRDFPGWLPGLMGPQRLRALADRHGECIYSACPHFNKCFVEKSVRKAKRADIVIANHALVMSQAALEGGDDLPPRVIFDEGHHIFEAADSAFSARLNGTETEALKRWLLGNDSSQRTRARGIRRRLEDIVADDDKAVREMDALLDAARALPGHGWRERLKGATPKGATEQFLLLCKQQVEARSKDAGSPYSLETPPLPPVPGLCDAARALSARLKDLQRPMLALSNILLKKLEDEAETLETDMRQRIHFLSGSLKRRANGVAGTWIGMLESLTSGAAPDKKFSDWFEIVRIEGMDRDVGFARCYVDPAAVFAEQMKPHAQGIAVTSATLRDRSDADPEGWAGASARAGLGVFAAGGDAPRFFHVESPFDYASQTRVIVVSDVNRDNPAETAAAFRELFLASGGGALGIFTAVQRLRTVHARLLPELAEKGIPLYAQHADHLDIATLIDIFREEEDACLLGTDATRDGIDVPGRALRLVVYDRVPWPRPSILHKARRTHFGKGYDDMLTRFKLKQAYGRLIRSAGDRGVFVMLDSGLPSRLLTAFPEGVEVVRTGLKEALEITKKHLP